MKKLSKNNTDKNRKKAVSNIKIITSTVHLDLGNNIACA
jgi:hypothetical protein